MKKLAIMLALCTVSVLCHAQSDTRSRYAKLLDTITSTGVKNMTTLKVGGAMQSVTITTANTQLTGTMQGIARLYGSLDGVKYERIRANQLHNSQVDSLIIDAAHPNYGWVVDNNPYLYYQVQTTGVGSSTYTIQGKYLAH